MVSFCDCSLSLLLFELSQAARHSYRNCELCARLQQLFGVRFFFVFFPCVPCAVVSVCAVLSVLVDGIFAAMLSAAIFAAVIAAIASCCYFCCYVAATIIASCYYF